ncbi:DUF2397 domain-containing protein [Streptomyces spectabilis]|uniref:DUF2397 domain-containing protein n=1 Tax=Streptomyces spectabilis TaxID=68270 RepID=UPI0033DB25E2
MSAFDPDPHGRLALYRYLTADNWSEYIRIMDVFCETLLSDLTLADLGDRIAAAGSRMPVDTLRARCESLMQWGNLMSSTVTPHAATVAEFVHAKDRFQLTPLGDQVHREVMAILSLPDGVREVAREVLGQTVALLRRVHAQASGPGPMDTEAVAGDVTSIFSNHKVFRDGLRTFYAYLKTVLARYDLGGDEYITFKRLLLQYVGLISADVARHAPVIADLLQRLEPWLDDVVGLLQSMPMAVNPDGSEGERLPGRRRRDWTELADWYASSGPSQLRTEAEQALGQLIANARRMLSSAGTGASRRMDFLRLASVFRDERGARAHRLFAAVFGMFGSRHLAGSAPDSTGQVTPSVSWWEGDVVYVPVAWRGRGSRGAAGGGHGHVPSVRDEQEAEAAAGAREEEERRSAVRELLGVGALDRSRISWQALRVLLGWFGRMSAQTQDEAVTVVQDFDVGAELEVRLDSEGRTAVDVGSSRVTFEGMVLSVRGMGQSLPGVEEG